MNTHTHLYVTSPPRSDLSFLIHFTGKGGSEIFKCSALSMRSADWNVRGFHQKRTFIPV